MTNHLTIALDAMGGDSGPEAVVSGAALALEEKPGLRFLFVGDDRKVRPLVDAHPSLKNVSEIQHTDSMVRSDEKPSVALRTGRQSSMRLAINAVAEKRAVSVVSSGNTGALMAMAKFVLKSLPGIHRPAIASVFPTMSRETVMLDLGANVVCNAENLVQFAVLGAVYARVIRGVEKPSVGLLNVGTEEMKGHMQLRQAASILKNIEFPGSFHGYIEGNDIPLGTVDVVVTDGFTGNVALKLAEGMGTLTSHYVREAFMSSLFAKLGGMLAYPAMRRLKKRVDPRYYNGGMFLGLDGVCVKSHGSSDAYGFSRAVLVAANLAGQGYNERVREEIENLVSQESFFSDDLLENETT